MKRIIAIVAAALVGLTACNKLGTVPEDGTYISSFDYGPAFTVTLSNGKCTGITCAGQPQQAVITTTGHYPKYTYQFGEDTEIVARFTDTDSFTATIAGAFAAGENTITAVEFKGVVFTRQ